MSNKRYEVNTPGVSPVDRDVTKLLYVSTAKYGGDWHSLMHTHAMWLAAWGSSKWRKS